MNLNKKLKTGVLAAGLVAVLGTSACQTTNRGGDEALLGILLVGAGVQQNKPAVAAVGSGLVRYGAAKAGKSEVNVNIHGRGEENRESDFIREIDGILGGGKTQRVYVKREAVGLSDYTRSLCNGAVGKNIFNYWKNRKIILAYSVHDKNRDLRITCEVGSDKVIDMKHW